MPELRLLNREVIMPWGLAVASRATAARGDTPVLLGTAAVLARTVLLVTVALSAAVGPVAAQSPSVLSLLPVESGLLQVGTQQTGTLSAADHLSTQETYLDAWELTGPVGSSVTVDLRSDAFDSYLFIVGPGLGETLVDDDSAGACHARIQFTILEDGPYRVVASSISPRATGAYTLSAHDVPPPALGYACGESDPAELGGLPTDGRELMLGVTGRGTLDFLSAQSQERPVEAWTLRVVPGEALVVVQESDAFDSYLYIVGPDIEGALADDDSAGELNSRIEFTPATQGPYTVVASALTEGATGSYTLRVEAPLDLASLPATGALAPVGETTGLMAGDEPIIMDGRRGQVWSLEGVAGQRIAIELRSDAFDAFLYVAGPGLVDHYSDDDSAGDLNSRITLTFPETGSYRVIASALDATPSGPYTLTVSPMR